MFVDTNALQRVIADYYNGTGALGATEVMGVRGYCGMGILWLGDIVIWDIEVRGYCDIGICGTGILWPGDLNFESTTVYVSSFSSFSPSNRI